jgi:hypothetical protein
VLTVEALTTQTAGIAPALLADRGMLNLGRAQAYLAGRLRARTALGAVEYLELNTLFGRETYEQRLEIAVKACDLYRLLFPRQFAASQTPPYSLAREQELYLLVDRHLFPLCSVIAEYSVEEAVRANPQFFLPAMSVRSMQKHAWGPGAFDWRRVETVYMLAQALSRRADAAGSDRWPAFALMHGLDCPAPAPPLCAVGWQLFSYACAVEETPLRWLPSAFHVTNYSTKSVFLDLPPKGSVAFDWEPAEVAKLLAHRQLAERILAEVAACDEWLDGDPRARIARAVELWNRAAEVEAQSGYEGVLAGEGEYLYVPEMPALTALMGAA